MFPAEFESDRLRFVRLTRETLDPAELYETFGRNADVEKVYEYVDRSPYRTVKEAADAIDRSVERFDTGTAAQYAIRPRHGEDGAGQLAGITGIYPKWDRRIATLGIVLDEPFWGRGYAGERAATFLELAFEDLDLEIVAVKYIDGNTKSKRAIESYVERFGGQYEGLVRNDLHAEGSIYDCHRYSISRAAYDAAPGRV